MILLNHEKQVAERLKKLAESIYKKEVGKKLRKLRVKYRLTQGQVATILRVDRSAYAYYETGRSLPSYSNLVTLAKIYSVTTDSILGYDGKVTLKEKAEIIACLANSESTRYSYNLLLTTTNTKENKK